MCVQRYRYTLLLKIQVKVPKLKKKERKKEGRKERKKEKETGTQRDTGTHRDRGKTQEEGGRLPRRREASEEPNPAVTLASDFWPPEPGEDQFMPPSLGCFVTAAPENACNHQGNLKKKSKKHRHRHTREIPG